VDPVLLPYPSFLTRFFTSFWRTTFETVAEFLKALPRLVVIGSLLIANPVSQSIYNEKGKALETPPKKKSGSMLAAARLRVAEKARLRAAATGLGCARARGAASASSSALPRITVELISDTM